MSNSAPLPLPVKPRRKPDAERHDCRLVLALTRGQRTALERVAARDGVPVAILARALLMRAVQARGEAVP